MSDDRIIAGVSTLLRVGLVVALTALLIGGTVFLVRHGHEPAPARHRFQEQPAEYRSPPAIVKAAGQGGGRAMVQVGLLVLIAVPVLRVAFTVYAFARQRDVVYVVVPLVVLALLLVGLFSGATH